ncbi:MAG: hypothetical protein GY754_18405 [bacterium]|nr:hypothetical protein [bacterium]
MKIKQLKIKLLSAFILLPVLLSGTALMAADMHLNWENLPEAVKYAVTIKDSKEAIILDRKTGSSSIDCRLSSGSYKVKIGMVLSKNVERVSRETKWIDFTVKADQFQSPPGEPELNTIYPGNGSLTADLSWFTPGGADESTTMYRIYWMDGDKYVDAKKSGFIRIGQREGSVNKVQKYLVYKWRDEDFRVIGETTKNQFMVKGLDPDENHTFAVRSVNILGNKSDKVDIKAGAAVDSALNIGLMPSYIMPIGYFSEHLNAGMGGMLSVSKNGLFVNNLEPGLKAGYWYFSGKKEDTEKSEMIPLLASVKYNFNITRTFRISPVISGGACMIAISKSNADDTSVVRSLVMGGVMFEKTFTDYLYAAAGSEFGTMFDGDRAKLFTVFSVTVGTKF